MGVTGAGKSSFISTCSGKSVKIGHNLHSCTADVEDVDFMYNKNLRVHLIDTPGFDDTNRSDVQVLQDLAHWLSGSFKYGIRLSGVVFLHRISDPRMASSARRNLLMFKKLCGEKAYQSVILGTTHWSNVSPQDGTRRERELIETDEYWGLMCKKGSRVFRYANTRESALSLIGYILKQHMTVTLDIQDEMVNKGHDIDETSAAHELNAEIIQTLKEVDKRKEAEFRAFKEQMKKERDQERQRYDAERQKHMAKVAQQEKALKEQQRRAMERMEKDKASLEEMARKQKE
ncbi:hypothetical protein BGZ57DRAFT_807112, partial [Hyaloscypha finlandica]